MTLEERINNYKRELKYPNSLFLGEDGRLSGIWVMGNNYSTKTEYYGSYPHGYLKRIKALFPDKENVLHLFSGKVDTEIIPGKRIDINPESGAEYICDAHFMSEIITDKFDMILADPPYSIEDCEHYGTIMVNRNKILKQCVSLLQKGGHLVWLDQVLPMYKKDELKTIGYIGMVKSTNHRFRVITIFEKVND